MKNTILICLLFLFSFTLMAQEPSISKLEGEYQLVLYYGAGEKEIIPLAILDSRPATFTAAGDIFYTDGIYCNEDGKYLDGYCRFTDKSGGNWQIRISIEPFGKKRSMLSVNLVGKEWQQQVDFVFPGHAYELMNMQASPFSLHSIPYKKGETFVVSLRDARPYKKPRQKSDGKCHH